MTTILGIKAYDPNRKTDYILLAADSQLTQRDQYNQIIHKDYGCRKIFRNPQTGLIFNYAGTCIEPKTKNFTEITKDAFNQLIKEKINKKDIPNLIKKIGLQYKNTYFIGSNANSNLSLDSIYYPVIPVINKRFSKIVKISKNLDSAFGGSGQDFADKKITSWLNIDEINGEIKCVVPLYTLLFATLLGLNNASEKDIYTGGHMDFAIITPNRWTCCWNFASLDSKKNRPFDRIIKDTENGFKKFAPYLTGNHLDEILLGY